MLDFIETIPEGYKNLKKERTDKNGTIYYTGTCDCIKCGGIGEIEYYRYNSNGVCFSCNGFGYHSVRIKVYTKEHAEKLEKARIRRIEIKKAESIANAHDYNAKFIKDYGFNSDGIGYVTLGNTYEIKDELKSMGGRFYSDFWIIPVKTDICEVAEIKAHDCFSEYDSVGHLIWTSNFWSPISKVIEDYKAKKIEHNKNSTSYFGNIGDKIIDIKATYIHTIWYETQYGGMGIHLFKDSDGHTFVWKSANGVYIVDNDGIDRIVEAGTEITIKKATIKEHTEYNGVKQTCILRCKFSV